MLTNFFLKTTGFTRNQCNGLFIYNLYQLYVGLPPCFNALTSLPPSRAFSRVG